MSFLKAIIHELQEELSTLLNPELYKFAEFATHDDTEYGLTIIRRNTSFSIRIIASQDAIRVTVYPAYLWGRQNQSVVCTHNYEDPRAIDNIVFEVTNRATQCR